MNNRTYMYNAVLQENDICPAGELLTDKELERMKLHNRKRDWPRTAMENNKSQFKRTGVLHDGAECIEIQISHSGDAARYVSTIMFTVRDPEVTRGRWQEIRYSKRNGYAYIVKYGKRLYLHKFLRIY